MWTRKFFYLDEENGDGGNGDGGDTTTDTTTTAADTTTTTAADTTTTTAADTKTDTTTTTDTTTQKPGDWPDDWRQKLSPDGKHSKTLDRFASPNAILDSYIALRQKVDSGELKVATPYPDKGKPEEQAAWRKAHGIPDKPEEYNLKFEDGLVIGDADKPIVDDFLKVAHEANTSPEQVNKLLHWYYGNQEKALEAQAEKDRAFLAQSEDTLRAEWGGEYRANVNMIKGLVDTMPASIQDLFVNSRLSDGTALMNHPDMARWLVHNARTINPVATVVPGAGANISGAIDDEITQIETLMKTDRKAYNADAKIQARLRELYNARDRARQ